MNLELIVIILLVSWVNIILYFRTKIGSFNNLILITLVLSLYTLINKNFIVNISYFIFLLLSLLFSIMGILADRKYIYVISLIIFILIPIFIYFDLNKYAEFLGATGFLILSLGFIKDVLYEKIFN